MRFALCALFAFLTSVMLFTTSASAQSAHSAKPTPWPSPPAPATALHTAFIVATNKKGQVVTVKAEQKDRDAAFNLMTFGNAEQMFIRTADGGAIPGRYRVTYDYAPETKEVKRNIALVSAGGVDPEALGAVDRIAADRRRLAERASKARKAKASLAPAKPAATR
jgi:hypothetical protein